MLIMIVGPLTCNYDTRTCWIIERTSTNADARVSTPAPRWNHFHAATERCMNKPSRRTVKFCDSDADARITWDHDGGQLYCIIGCDRKDNVGIWLFEDFAKGRDQAVGRKICFQGCGFWVTVGSYSDELFVILRVKCLTGDTTLGIMAKAHAA